MLLESATKDHWAVYLTGALITSGALGTFGAWVFQVARQRLRARGERKEQRAAVEAESATYRALSRVRDILYDLRGSVDASRVVLMKSHNGGGPIKVFEHTYTSVIHEAARTRGDRVKEKWQGRPIDLEYAQLLARIDQEHDVHMVTVDVPEDSDLGEWYRASGTTHSRVHKIGKTGFGMVYLSVNFDSDHVSPGNSQEVKGAAAELRRLFSEYEPIFGYDYGWIGG